MKPIRISNSAAREALFDRQESNLTHTPKEPNPKKVEARKKMQRRYDAIEDRRIQEMDK